MTGLYPHKHRNYYNYSNPPYDHEIYLSRLAEHGYQNIYIGKWHAGSGTALDFQAEGFSCEDYGNPYRTQEYKDYLKSRKLPDPEHCVEYFFSGEMLETNFPAMKKGPGYRSEGSWSGEHAVGITLSPKETHESFFLANLACDKLEHLSKSAPDRPFHLRVDFWGPHQPHFPTQEYAELYDADEISEYGSFRDDLSGKPSVYWYDFQQPPLIDVIVSEWLGGGTGLGWMMLNAKESGLLKPADLWIGLFIVSGAATGLFYIASALERIAIPWHESVAALKEAMAGKSLGLE